ncbi:HAMP domain-containing sensor histidine kinase [Clostridium sp. UBA7503]|uniref:HAMP domain-containing sensor histidine kinase n=1 Tax=Clostridium sp. UBA7503 TaxID=1946377 RepID=UPI003216B64E
MNKIINYYKKIKENIEKSITLKMFVVTTVVFIAFLTITLLSQRILFEKIYNDKKENDIKSNVIKFRDTLSNPKDEREIIESIKKFENNYNTSIGVVNTENNIIVTFKTDSETIDSKNTEIFNYVIKTIKTDPELLNEMINKKQVTISFKNGENTKYLASALLHENNIIVGFTSLQYVKEAMGVIGIFYKYFYLGAIVVIVILALIYSKFITKPLREINKVAVRMSNLDFSQSCTMVYEDEIGNLGETLNFLGQNLDNSLNSLKEVNRKLQNDIHREREIEIMRKEFIADVSHELKTPITLIKGYAEGIKDGVFLEDNMNSSLNVIIEESDKMSNLVRDMLQISSLESGKVILNKELFFIDNLVKNVVKKLHHSIDNKNVKIDLNLYEKQIYGDAFKIEQVITNFLTNAIRHTPCEGSIFVKMYPRRNMTQLSFENTGELINKEEIDKIWDKFYKIDKSRNRKDSGTGLGLSIVKNIVDLHQGKCGVENTKRGVRFYFELPNQC